MGAVTPVKLRCASKTYIIIMGPVLISNKNGESIVKIHIKNLGLPPRPNCLFSPHPSKENPRSAVGKNSYLLINLNVREPLEIPCTSYLYQMKSTISDPLRTPSFVSMSMGPFTSNPSTLLYNTPFTYFTNGSYRWVLVGSNGVSCGSTTHHH